MRIAIAGFQHETNTFASSKAGYDDFILGGGWPALASGPGIIEAVAGANIPLAGFIAAAESYHHILVPTTWCAASPSAHVTEDAYERISGMILAGIRDALPVDAVYLDLHGAMVTEHLDDGEGELLRRVRILVGPKIPVVASLDLHANVTARMIECADELVAYRTYPHIDMAETGARAFALLQKRLSGKPRPFVAARRIPFLIPICWQSTHLEPGRSLYASLEDLESGDVSSVSFAAGFPAADFPECGPVVLAYGSTQAAADHAAELMAAKVLAAEAQFAGKLYNPDEAVMYAMEQATKAGRPVVIADTQDNPGAGGNSDTTGVLRALMRHQAKRASIGLIVDRKAALAAHAAGVGARIRIDLGGHSGVPGDAPLEAEFVVEALSDGRFDATGPFYRGFHMNLGPSACLRINDIRIVVASVKAQMADQAMFRYVGIDPLQQAILVVKSSAHFRADFTPIAEEILVCVSPGAMIADTAQLPWTRLRAGIRTAPCGKAFDPANVQGAANTGQRVVA